MVSTRVKVSGRLKLAVPLSPRSTLTSMMFDTADRKVDVRLPGKGNSHSHGVRPVYSNHLDDSVDSDQ